MILENGFAGLSVMNVADLFQYVELTEVVKENDKLFIDLFSKT